VLPTVAAAALVVTATGATVAQTAPAYFDFTGSLAKARAQDAAASHDSRVESEQQRELQTSALRSRQNQAQRIARSAQRTTLAQRAAATTALAQADAARTAREKWVMPIHGAVFTSGFGWRWGRLHAGDDFATPVGTPLSSMSSGTVTFAGWESGYGNKIEIQYWDGTVSEYAHLSRVAVSVGDSVAPGTLVGYSGDTGHSTGPHLHLEIHPNGGAPIDPAPWLRAHGLQ
jgi:murein DD-endopeptidase MepM/ murein hydrolase activator NlpD